MIHRGEQVAGCDGAIGGCTGMGVAGADNLPSANAAARQNHAPDARPVVAAARRIEPWRAAKFTRSDHQCRFESTTPLQVIDQSRERAIECGKQLLVRNHSAC